MAALPGRRRKHVGVVKGIFLFLRLSLYYAVYSLRFVARTWGRRGTSGDSTTVEAP